ncbi:MAG: prohead core protein, partial [Bacilli bacterium]
MSIKQQLLEAAKTIKGTVQLDSIFESADLSADMKVKFQTVFESAVKTQAVALAETHISEIAEKSEEMVESRVQEELTDLTETLHKYLDHVAGKWLEENKEAVSNGIKVDMFESLMVGMKDLFVEHNVTVPEDAVDVVAELEDEIAESREELNVAINAKEALIKEMNTMKRDHMVESATAALTESQKEKVKSLIEGLDYDEAFDTKLSAIVEMTSNVQAAVVEPTTHVEESITPNFEQDAPEVIVEAKQDTAMSAYLAAL